ncbi:MAG TPA: glycosyltransferase family 87 protein [Candidatus Limnocylindrales bacterium]|nr:glycosyltransferase family 87 protein [Candidatus Limnocylindrales bacterium]
MTEQTGRRAERRPSGSPGSLPSLRRLGRAALPVSAVAVFVLFAGAVLRSAGDTLGFDFLAYHQAARRILDGLPLYDLAFESAGGFGLFYYPPPFAVLLLPLGLLDPTVATWVWTGLLVGAFGLGVALLPVAPAVRWTTVLLAGLSWPFLYALKLGQIGPILFLLFAAGWRWLDDPARLGVSAGLGAILKIQPGLVLVWALLTRRWRAVVAGAALIGVAALVAAVVTGPGSWLDYAVLLRRVSDPITTAHNFTPGAMAWQLGAPIAIAAAVQVATTLLVLGVVVVAALRASAESSYLVVVVASQLLSPILWDHYALLLLLPTAWLLQRGHWWAVAMPLATALPLVGLMPPLVYPLSFTAGLLLPLVFGLRDGRVPGPVRPTVKGPAGATG